MLTTINLEVNGKARKVEVDTRTVLADMIRDSLRLTGTHIGCGTGSCGACTIMLNGESVKSCCVLAADADGQKIMTIEGFGGDPKHLHPIQQAFVAYHGLQCGYCTPGMVLSAYQLLSRNPSPDEN
jgi:carbon-monoxide dehydrogenase small subunit